ncbi:hypothetical protein RUM44_008713 [Polyplax serrata]|uniref:Uncharacterized protein n=1 Tax=Polyplax serrata TaxID=468196 RepID=A0ABR1BCZ9_POLSC
MANTNTAKCRFQFVSVRGPTSGRAKRKRNPKNWMKNVAYENGVKFQGNRRGYLSAVSKPSLPLGKELRTTSDHMGGTSPTEKVEESNLIKPGLSLSFENCHV